MTIYAGDECSQRLNLDSHRVLRGAIFNFEVGVDGQNGFGLCVAQVAKDRRCVRYGRFEGGIFHDRGKSAEMWAGSEGRSKVDQQNSWETNHIVPAPFTIYIFFPS